MEKAESAREIRRHRSKSDDSRMHSARVALKSRNRPRSGSPTELHRAAVSRPFRRLVNCGRFRGSLYGNLSRSSRPSRDAKKRKNGLSVTRTAGLPRACRYAPKGSRTGGDPPKPVSDSKRPFKRFRCPFPRPPPPLQESVLPRDATLYVSPPPLLHPASKLPREFT